METSLTSPGLIKAANDALVQATPDLNMIRLFSYDFSDDVADYGYTVKVPLAASGALSSEFGDDNDYETLNGSVTYATITLNKQPKQTFKFSGKDVLEAPNAPYWNKVAEAAANGVRGNISQTFGKLFTAASCTGGKVVLSGDVTLAKIAKLRKECLGRVANTVLGLNSEKYNEAISLFTYATFGNQEPMATGMLRSALGFKAIVEVKDLPDGVLGVIVPDNAVATASRRVAVGDESCFSEVGSVQDENGFNLTVLRHGSAAKGTGFLNTTCLYGMALIQPTKIKYIAAS